jgi:predicted transcriptional regulator
MLFEILALLHRAQRPLTLAEIQEPLGASPQAVAQGVHILVGQGRLKVEPASICRICRGCSAKPGCPASLLEVYSLTNPPQYLL